jgi:hypothetical protein
MVAVFRVNDCAGVVDAGEAVEIRFEALSALGDGNAQGRARVIY